MIGRTLLEFKNDTTHFTSDTVVIADGSSDYRNGAIVVKLSLTGFCQYRGSEMQEFITLPNKIKPGIR